MRRFAMMVALSALVFSTRVVVADEVQPVAADSADRQVTADDANRPLFSSRFGDPLGNSQNRYLYLYFKQDPGVVWTRREGDWQQATPVAYPQGGHTVFRVPFSIQPESDSTVWVSTWPQGEGRNFRVELKFVADATEPQIQVVQKLVRSRDEIAAERASRRERQSLAEAQDPYGFVSLLNNYRARMGQGPVVHDVSLSQQASQNNQSGSPHGYVPGGCCQNWCSGTGSADGALQMWINSSGHNANLLRPWVRRVGIAFSNGNWTMNGAR